MNVRKKKRIHLFCVIDTHIADRETKKRFMEGPLDTRRFIEVPREDNPNLMDVYEVPTDGGVDDNLIRASLTAPPSRPPPQPRVAQKHQNIGFQTRTNVANMEDGADPSMMPSANKRATGGIPSLADDDPDELASLHKRAKEDGEMVFGYRLYDWQNGTPLDDVSFDAIKRHLHRLALHTIDPVVTFVAGVALSSGSGVDNFFANGNRKPSINLTARSMSELVHTSPFEAQFLLPLLALTVLQLFGKAAQSAPTEVKTGKVELTGGGKGGGGTGVPGSPANSNNNSFDIDLVTPKKEVKTEPAINVKIASDASPLDVIRKAQHLIGNQVQWDQHHSPLEPIGINTGALDRLRGAREFERRARLNLLAQEQLTPYDELRLLFEEMNDNSPFLHSQRWYWNSLPENSGMSLVKPEVRKAIYDTFEDIRALSEGHRQFKLWHLMTR
jgi:hypothetical protein